VLNNILSIDYGERYLGVAVRTEKTTIPIPVTVLDSKKNNILNDIEKYIDTYNISMIVIGYPIGLNNSENRMTNLVNNFINDLNILNIEVHKIDERLSSKLFKNSSSDRIDDLSALEILESYIAQHE
jgi:putative transcription antitermination factor YqgF|tara:strand:- start:2797 stop:3177 length:381 start_codon:yes stop_codon:yes gene_type:complete